MSAQTEIGIGSEFVGYRIDELIARGGMGVVFRAHDLRLKRSVALKLMAPELALDRRFRERFSRETELAMSLEHPNVVPIHDGGEIDGRLYLAMRYVEGTDLRALLQAEAPLDKARSLAICSQVANALDAAHAKGLVHRDVKPSNVLLDADEHVYLADFGLTRRVDEQGGGDHRSVGTPAYLAPEQIEGGPVDGRADVYALGCLLYECLTGEAPFARGSRLAVAWAHLEEEPPRASARRPELPEAIDAVIQRAMAKEPDDRYPTCAAFVAAVEQALELRPRRLRLIAAAVGIVVLAAVAAAVVLTRSPHKAGIAPITVRPNSLVRIDPATDKVVAAVGVGRLPSAAAVGGRSVWVYNASAPSLSEIDAETETLRHTTKLIARPRPASVFEGPVLAAGSAGAWIIGTDGRRRSYLTHVFSGPRGKHEYLLEQEPRAIAIGYGAVWVATNGARDNELLRIAPTTGKISGTTRFPRSEQVDGIAVGFGHVWVVASSTGELYRIDPRSGRVTGRNDLLGRVTPPTVVYGFIWVGTTAMRGDTLVVKPQTDSVVDGLGCCAPTRGYSTVGFGSIWTFDSPTGTVERWSGVTHQGVRNIHVTSPPFYGGSCLTSIASGRGAIWVTASPSYNYHC